MTPSAYFFLKVKPLTLPYVVVLFARDSLLSGIFFLCRLTWKLNHLLSLQQRLELLRWTRVQVWRILNLLFLLCFEIVPLCWHHTHSLTIAAMHQQHHNKPLHLPRYNCWTYIVKRFTLTNITWIPENSSPDSLTQRFLTSLKPVRIVCFQCILETRQRIPKKTKIMLVEKSYKTTIMAL